MSDIATAEAKMAAAREALLKYVEQRKQLDGDHYRQLVAEVKRAEAQFMRQVNDADK